MKEITFTPIFPVEDIFYPEPASKNLPEWYKKTESFANSNKLKIVDGSRNITIKKCIPVFDALSAGYIIKTYVDVYVELNEDKVSYYNWPMYEPIQFHSTFQASLHPLQNEMPFPKWINPWSIKTPNGYSCLFIPPMHNPNGIFTIMPGIVDTDSYMSPVNFPFTLNDPNFEGMIPAGTPICQVIPFKRDEFKMNIGSDKDSVDRFSLFFNNRWINSYKNRFWHKKTYK